MEEDFSLVIKGMKTKGKKSQGEEGKKKDLSNIKFFHCHEFRHYDKKEQQAKLSIHHLSSILVSLRAS